jgi:nucleotide-binding universal stress UspA family protein
MRILLVVDGSPYSDMAAATLKALQLPTQVRVTVMTVVPEFTFLGGIKLDTLRSGAPARKKAQQARAAELVSGPARLLQESNLKVDNLVRWGHPAEVILEIADKIGASLVVMGAKGLTDPVSFHLGSVAHKVMRQAKASILLVKKRISPTVKRVLLATDGSQGSDIAAQFLLNLPLPQPSQVILVTALHSHTASLTKTPTLGMENDQQLLVTLQAAEETQARRIIARGEEQFQKRGYQATSLIVRGGAAEAILTAAKEHNPDIIALGSRGLTGLESILLGSVAERVARYARCSVLIGRVPV